MSVAATEQVHALARTPEEYERLRAQSRVWESATGRLLDRVGLAPGQRCLDAGCGPGETMRLMAERVGPSGSVTGIDVDVALGEAAIAMLRAHGHRQCQFAPGDVTAEGSIAGAQFDLVYARLLLYHLPERVAVLRRLWEVVAPGGHLVIQDYDVRSADVVPALETVEEFKRVVVDAFSAAGCDVHVGARLPELFAQAGIGTPEGTDVAGRLERLADARRTLRADAARSGGGDRRAAGRRDLPRDCRRRGVDHAPQAAGYRGRAVLQAAGGARARRGRGRARRSRGRCRSPLAPVPRSPTARSATWSGPASAACILTSTTAR